MKIITDNIMIFKKTGKLVIFENREEYEKYIETDEIKNDHFIFAGAKEIYHHIKTLITKANCDRENCHFYENSICINHEIEISEDFGCESYFEKR